MSAPAHNAMIGNAGGMMVLAAAGVGLANAIGDAIGAARDARYARRYHDALGAATARRYYGEHRPYCRRNGGRSRGGGRKPPRRLPPAQRGDPGASNLPAERGGDILSTIRGREQIAASTYEDMDVRERRS